MSCDYHYHDRLRELADLMAENPDELVYDLQRQALAYYPLESQACINHWMSIHTAFLASEIRDGQNIDAWLEDEA